MTLEQRTTLSEDRNFIGRVTLAATITAIQSLSSQAPSPEVVAASRAYLTEPAIWGRRIASLAAAVVPSADVSDEDLQTLIDTSWGFLVGVMS